MNGIKELLGLVEPGDDLKKLGELLRLKRQREELTQPELAKKSGVPKTTISRLEREGLGGTESLLRVMFALGMLEDFDGYLNDRLRLAKFPKSLNEGKFEPVLRVRHRRNENAS